MEPQAELAGMTRARTFAGALLLAAILAGCGSAPTGAAATDRSAAASGPAPEAKMVALPFRLDVTFTPAALARLSALEAGVKVSADYYGLPKAAGAARVDPELAVWLGGETFAIEPGARSLTFKGRIDAAQVAREVGGDARVRVTAVLERGADPAAVVCAPFDEYLPIAVETGGTVHCAAAGE